MINPFHKQELTHIEGGVPYRYKVQMCDANEAAYTYCIRLAQNILKENNQSKVL